MEKELGRKRVLKGVGNQRKLKKKKRKLRVKLVRENGHL